MIYFSVIFRLIFNIPLYIVHRIITQKYFILFAISAADCYSKRNQPAKPSVNKQSLLIYEDDVIHHFIATELSYVRIEITFVSSFISVLERHIKPSVQLEIAKRKPRFREERKK